MEQQQIDLLQDVNEETNYIEPASPGLRFVNHFIDLIILVVIFFSCIFILASFSTQYLIFEEDRLATFLQSLLFSTLTVIYYTILETASGGRTMGKWATGTIAITQDGSPFTFKHALLRSLCRLIPFEALSAFGFMPWHDSITKTVVTKKTW